MSRFDEIKKVTRLQSDIPCISDAIDSERDYPHEGKGSRSDHTPYLSHSVFFHGFGEKFRKKREFIIIFWRIEFGKNLLVFVQNNEFDIFREGIDVEGGHKFKLR
jgi:hypothetical protein